MPEVPIISELPQDMLLHTHFLWFHAKLIQYIFCDSAISFSCLKAT